jgi:hypothetical protein
MMIAMDDMLWTIDPENDNMGKIILRVREYIDWAQEQAWCTDRFTGR